MQSRPTIKKRVRRLSPAEKNYNAAMAKMEKAINKAGYVLFPALALALNEEYGWKKDHITKVLNQCQEVWQECASTEGISMVEMCYNETGIAVTNDSGKDFEELSYMSEAYWSEAKKHLHFKTREQELMYLTQVRLKQCEWMEAVISAGIFLSLHRREGFGFDRNMRVYNRMRIIKLNSDNNPKELCELCKSRLHMDMEAHNGFFFFEGRDTDDKQAI